MVDWAPVPVHKYERFKVRKSERGRIFTIWRLTLWAIGRHSDISIHEWSRLSLPGNGDDCIRAVQFQLLPLLIARPLLSSAYQNSSQCGTFNQTLKRKIGNKIARLSVFSFMKAKKENWPMWIWERFQTENEFCKNGKIWNGFLQKGQTSWRF